jgi:WD40 repeat protein
VRAATSPRAIPWACSLAWLASGCTGETQDQGTGAAAAAATSGAGASSSTSTGAGPGSGGGHEGGGGEGGGVVAPPPFCPGQDLAPGKLTGEYDDWILCPVTPDQACKAWQPGSFMVTAMSFSPDGKLLATAGFGDVHVYDTASWTELYSIYAHWDSITSLSFSPDGTQFATSSWDGAVSLWRTSDGEEIRTFETGKNIVGDVRFSPDGTSLLAAGNDGAKLWRIEDAALLRSFSAPSGYIAGDFSADGSLIALGASRWPSAGDGSENIDGLVHVHAASDGALVRTLAGHAGRIWTLRFSPEGARLASGGDDAAIRLWDAATGELVLPAFGSHDWWVYDLSFSPDGKRLASASRDWTVSVAALPAGETIALGCHTYATLSVATSPCGDLVAAGDWDGWIRLWCLDR